MLLAFLSREDGSFNQCWLVPFIHALTVSRVLSYSNIPRLPVFGKTWLPSMFRNASTWRLFDSRTPFIFVYFWVIDVRFLFLHRWRQPSLSIHKIDVTGPAHSTVIPASAQSAVSIRIVPDQSLEDISRSLVSFLEEAFKPLNSSNTLEVPTF